MEPRACDKQAMKSWLLYWLELQKALGLQAHQTLRLIASPSFNFFLHAARILIKLTQLYLH